MPPRAKTVSGKNQWLAAKGHYDNNQPPPPPSGLDAAEPDAEAKPKGKGVSFKLGDAVAFPEPGHRLNPWPAPAPQPDGQFVQHIATDRTREYGLGPLYPDYIGAAAEWQKEHNAEHLRRKNASVTKHLLQMSEATKKENERMMKNIKPHLKQVYEGKNFALLKLLLKVALDRWPSMSDVREQIESIVPKLLTGFRNSGAIQPCGFWKKLQHRQVRARKLVAAAAVEKLSRSTKSPSRDHWAEEDHIEVMWRQKESMVSKGLWREVGADMVGRLGASTALPVPQHGKIRTCIDFRAQNETLVVEEKMRLLNSRCAMQLVSRFLSPRKQPPDQFQFRQDISSDVMGEKEIREQLQLHREIAAASDAAATADEVEAEPLESFIAASNGSDAEDKVEDESYVFNPLHGKEDLTTFYYQSGVEKPEENGVWLPVPWKVSHPQEQDPPLELPSLTAAPPPGASSSSTSFTPLDAPRKQDGLKRGRDSQKAAPRVRQWQLIMSLVALFGSLSSVHECVAVSETLQFLIAAVLRVTATVYIDDVHIMSRPSVSESDRALVNLMLLLLGWWRSDIKSEAMDRLLKRTLVVLGVAYEWLSRTTTIIRIDPDKVQELLLLGDAILQNKRIEIKQLERYRGLFRHCLQLSRSQVFLARALDRWCAPSKFTSLVGGRKQRASLMTSMRSMQTAAASVHPFKLTKFMREKQVIHAYTDAAIDDMMGCNEAIEQGVSDLSQFNMKLGGFVYINDFQQFAFAVHLKSLPKHVKKINIQVLEALSARICIDLYSPLLEQYFTVLHVDNLGDVYSLARNSSRDPTVQALSCAYHNVMQERELSTYITWICSERNISDVLTREHRTRILKENFEKAKVIEISEEEVLTDRVWNPDLSSTGPSACLAHLFSNN